MDDCRGLLLRARAVAWPNEAARLNEEADAVLAARAAGESPWGSELPPPFLQKVLELLQWEPAVCGVVRAVCSTWCGILDALLPRLRPRGSAAMMAGKLGWYQSVTEVELLHGDEGSISGVLAELGSMPSLRSLTLPSWCAEGVVDAEAVYGLTTLTSLQFRAMEWLDENGEPVEVEEAGEWVVDLSRLTTLSSLHLWECTAVTDKEVLALSNLTGLTDLNLEGCINATSEGLCAMSSLTGLTSLNLWGCINATTEVLRAVSSLTALTFLSLMSCENVPAEGLRAVSSLTKLIALDLSSCNPTTEGLRAVSRLTTLTSLSLCRCTNLTDEVLRAMSSLTALKHLNLTLCLNVTDEGLQTLSSLTALSTLDLYGCDHVTAAGKQALRTALPSLTIVD